MHKPSTGLIDPRSSKRMGYWDLTTSIALIFTALVTPYEVALLEPAETAARALFIINRLIDLIFSVDIGLQFFLITEKGSSEYNHRWITRCALSARAPPAASYACVAPRVWGGVGGR